MSRLTIPLPGNFDLAVTVTSYGYGHLAPNHWNSDRAELTTWLSDHAGQPLCVCVVQRGDGLILNCERKVERVDQPKIRRAVTRMLRIDEDLEPWFRLHRPARRHKFGRLIRSASLFEDMVKTITSCNVAWPNTVTMNQKLCECVGGGSFPSPDQLAAWREPDLKKQCRVGYRAERILRLARDVASGHLDLEAFEDQSRSSADVFDALRCIHGIGPYAAANILQHLGRYDHIPIDSECYRHFLETHHRDKPRPKALSELDPVIRQTYAVYQPYAFLAYWFELWRGETVTALRAK